MNKEVFIRIVDSLSNHSDYFKLKDDATGSKGLTLLQKCTTAIRQLAYGTPADQSDEYNQLFLNIEKQYHSGWSDGQVKDAARKLYYSTYKKSFKYEHVWAILKDEPKWNGGSADDVNTKRRKTSSSSYSTSSDAQTSINIADDETEVRPMGKKKAIRKRKEKATISNNESNNLRDLINETNTLRMSSINEVTGYLMDMRDSFKSSKRIEEIKILSQSTENMTYEQLGYHQMLCNEIKEKYGLEL